MKHMRLKWLVVTAFTISIIGIIGVAITINRELFQFLTAIDIHRYDTPVAKPDRYELRDEVIVVNNATLYINTNGGAIHVRESITNKIEIVMYLPYQPRNTDIALVQRDGTTLRYDSATVWNALTGNVSQPVIDVDISVPVGTSLDIRTSISDITIDAQISQVKIAASYGTLDIPSTHVERMDASYTVGANIHGNAPRSSNITLDTGEIDLYIDQAGTHSMRVINGNIALTLRKSLTVTTTQSAPNGAFYSQLTTPSMSNPDVYLYLSTAKGSITLIPR